MKYSNLLFCKLFPFLPKGFPRFFGGIKSTNLLNLSLLAVRSAFQLVYFIICISSTSQKLSLRRYISLPRVYVVVNKASEGGPTRTFFRRIIADPCFNLPEFHFILENSPKKLRALIGLKSCFYLTIKLRARNFYGAFSDWLRYSLSIL